MLAHAVRELGSQRPKVDEAHAVGITGACGGHPGREAPGAPDDERPDGAVSHGVGAAAGALFQPGQRSSRNLNRGLASCQRPTRACANLRTLF